MEQKEPRFSKSFLESGCSLEPAVEDASSSLLSPWKLAVSVRGDSAQWLYARLMQECGSDCFCDTSTGRKCFRISGCVCAQDRRAFLTEWAKSQLSGWRRAGHMEGRASELLLSPQVLSADMSHSGCGSGPLV